MKIGYIFLLMVFFVFSCRSEAKPGAHEKIPREKEAEKGFPIEIVLRKTKTATDVLMIKRLLKEKHVIIDSTFFADYFEGLKIKGQNSARIEYRSAVNWYFIDHRDLQDISYFQF